MKRAFISILIFLLLGCNSSIQKPSGMYLGQSLPGDSPGLFAPGIVNDGIATRDITFTPDGKEIYFSKNTANSAYSTILFCKETSNGWTQPEVLPFAQNPEFIFIEPFISPDGSKLFFVSNRGNEFTAENRFITDIWVADRIGENWGEPYKLDTMINSSESEFFPSVAKNGNLYFTRENNATREGYIYKSEFKNGKYQTPVLLPEQVNAGVARSNATIAPDESFIIVPVYGMPDSFGSFDYYISFFDDKNGWSNPINLGDNINSASRFEYSANFSPDGNYFFFMSSQTNPVFKGKLTVQSLKNIHNSTENGNSNIYWINAGFIQKLKEKAIFTKNEKQ